MYSLGHNHMLLSFIIFAYFYAWRGIVKVFLLTIIILIGTGWIFLTQNPWDLKSRGASDFGFRIGERVIWNLCIYILRYLRTATGVQHEIHLFCIFVMCNLKVILYNLFRAPVFCLWLITQVRLNSYPCSLVVRPWSILNFRCMV